MTTHMKPQCILAALMGVFCATLVSAAATLTHRYEFNGNLNDSAGSLTGVISGEGTASTAPLFGGSTPLGAVGSGQSLQVGQTEGKRSGFTIDASGIPGAGSISLWVQSDLTATTGDQADYVFNQGGDWAKGIRLFFRDNNTNRLRLSVGDTAVASTAFDLVQGTWYHVAVTWDSIGSAALYVNGTYIGGSDAVAAGKFATSPLNVGSWSFSSLTNTTTLVNQFHGSIYDFQIYDGRLAADEIALLAATPGIAIPEPSSMALIAGGLALGATGIRRRRR